MISEFFSDEELISQLRMFFNEDEQEHMDFQALLGQLTEVDSETWELRVKKRIFRIDKTFCDVTEVET